MSIVSMLIILCVIGFALWAANTYLPLDPKIKKILNFVVIAAVVIWLLSVFGVIGHFHDAQVPKL